MDMLDDVEFAIAKLELGPSDILAIRSGRPLTSIIAAELRSQIEQRFGLHRRVLVLDPNFELTVVARDDVPSTTQTRPAIETKTDQRRGGKG